MPVCMMWLFAVTQQEMWLLLSGWLATPALHGKYCKLFTGQSFHKLTYMNKADVELRCY